jgi:hypothetical protein
MHRYDGLGSAGVPPALFFFLERQHRPDASGRYLSALPHRSGTISGLFADNGSGLYLKCD